MVGAASAQNTRIPDKEDSQRGEPATVELIEAPQLRFQSPTDSNSPSVWALIGGRPTLVLFTSVAGRAVRSIGPDIAQMRPPRDISFHDGTPAGAWFEAVTTADDGTWYAYYHQEIPDYPCAVPGKVTPRIGAARSTDLGRSWTDLGPILEAPADTARCDSPNTYFLGGVGDLSVMLDPAHRDLYIFFSQYPSDIAYQGVAVARLAWADRDEPQGKVAVWRDGVWLPARWTGEQEGDHWEYPLGTPLFPTLRSWHADDRVVDAYWGPSVHWNTFLNSYVMLLNRAKDGDFTQEGIYVTFGRSLEDPSQWSSLQRIKGKGVWYPQVVGLEVGSGTDKQAGELARYFEGGVSDYLIKFTPATR